MRVRVVTRKDFSGINGFDAMVRRGRRSRSPSNPYRRMVRQWGVRYLGFVERRYIKQSRGGGKWPSLSAATKRRRRGDGERARVLIDTGTLLSALQPGDTGNRFDDVTGGVVVGFKGNRHPDGGATLAQIADYHQEGRGNLPKREILVEPDDATRRGFISDARAATRDALRRNRVRRQR